MERGDRALSNALSPLAFYSTVLKLQAQQDGHLDEKGSYFEVRCIASFLSFERCRVPADPSTLHFFERGDLALSNALSPVTLHNAVRKLQAQQVGRFDEKASLLSFERCRVLTVSVVLKGIEASKPPELDTRYLLFPTHLV